MPGARCRCRSWGGARRRGRRWSDGHRGSVKGSRPAAPAGSCAAAAPAARPCCAPTPAPSPPRRTVRTQYTHSQLQTLGERSMEGMKMSAAPMHTLVCCLSSWIENQGGWEPPGEEKTGSIAYQFPIDPDQDCSYRDKGLRHGMQDYSAGN